MENIKRKFDRYTGDESTQKWAAPREGEKSYSVKRLLRTLSSFWKNYCSNSSIVGYKYLSEPHRPWIEKILWIVIHITTMCILGFMIIGLWQQYINTPVVTVVDSDNYPSNKLDFPGIAICSINRISRKAAEDLAAKIKRSLVDKTLDDIFELVTLLGSLYDTAFVQNDIDNNAEAKRRAVNDMFLRYLGGNYDITEVMKSLTPKCSDILLACTYQNILRNCSELFEFRKTQNGFCCTFNYAREADDIPSSDDFKKYTKIYSKKIESPGIVNGLTIVLEPFIDDYLFPFLPTTGWMITIFNPGDYPDNTSGGVSEALISPSSESFLELSVSSFYSENDIRPVPVSRRKCMFTDETSAMQTGYTYSDCIVDCRATAIWKICNCRPFFLPRRGNNECEDHGTHLRLAPSIDSRKVCSIQDEPCIRRHKSIWWSVLPHTPDNDESSSYDKAIGDGNESLRCENCYPACTDTRYYLQMQSTRLEGGRLHRTDLLPNFEAKDQSIVHIYFKRYGSVRLKQDVGYYWYELLSDIGGICGVFVGFSLISTIEFFYFILRRCYTSGRHKNNTQLHKSNDEFQESITSAGGLYWNEILGRPNRPLKSDIFRVRRVQRY